MCRPSYFILFINFAGAWFVIYCYSPRFGKVFCHSSYLPSFFGTSVIFCLVPANPTRHADLTMLKYFDSNPWAQSFALSISQIVQFLSSYHPGMARFPPTFPDLARSGPDLLRSKTALSSSGEHQKSQGRCDKHQRLCGIFSLSKTYILDIETSVEEEKFKSWEQ